MTKATALTLSEIERDVCSYPPLRREEIRKTYVGKEVDWQTTFTNGWNEQKGQAGVVFQVEPLGLTIFGTVSLASYPWLESLGVGEAVQVRGTIRKLDGVSITLDIRELRVPETVRV